MATEPAFISPEEYLQRERASLEKSEYCNGQIFAMSGASARHAMIATNIAGELRTQLKGRSCSVFSADLRVLLSPTGLYTYPDIVVVCDGLKFSDEFKDTVTNATLIVEVLSKSTKNYDRGEKFEHYRTLESFKEYLLVAQDKHHVEHYVRQSDDTWILSETSDLTTAIRLSSIGCQLAMSEVYDKVDELPVG